MSNRRKGTSPHHIIPPCSIMKHLFVGDVPLLYPEVNVSRQVQVEVWLDLKLDLGSYGIETVSVQYQEIKRRLEYVI